MNVRRMWHRLQASIDELYAKLAGVEARAGETIFSVVLRPGDTSGAPNVFTTWTALYAVCSLVKGGVRVVFDDSLVSPIHIPTGAYAIDQWRWEARANYANVEGGAIVTLDDGVTLTFGQWAIGGWLEVTATCATTSVVTLAAGECNVSLEPFALLESVGAHAFFSVPAGLNYLWIWAANCTLGDATHALISTATGSGVQINLLGASLRANAITGTGAAAALIFYDAGSSIGAGGITATQSDQATQVHYAPAAPGNWSPAPTDVGPALDQLAGARIFRLTQAVTLANLQALGASATGSLNVGAALPANARIVNPCPEVVVSQAFAGSGLTTVTGTVQATTDSAGTLGTAVLNSGASSHGLITPTNPYASRGGQQLQITVTLAGGTLLNGLTGGAFTVNVYYAVVL